MTGKAHLNPLSPGPSTACRVAPSRNAQGRSDAAHPRVIVLGPHALQNQLLSAYIHQETGFDAQSKSMPNGDDAHDVPSGRAPQLYLIDCLAAPDTIPLQPASPLLQSAVALAALFNVRSGSDVEEKALSIGIRGVFYAADAPEIMIKGVKALVAGELWFSRQVSSRLLWRRRSDLSPAAPSEALTKREIEILQQLASGGNNQQIADALCISLHTVKTHLYNIYRKIEVENRLQASIWAGSRLHHLQAPAPTALP